MTRDVLVRVKGTQIVDGDHESVEVITAGRYYKRDGRHYIVYDESAEGLDETTHNRIRAHADGVEVTKRGTVECRMVFERGKKNMANYMTPVGLIVLGLTTLNLQVEEKENTIHIYIEYALEMNGDYVSSCQMDISAQPRGKSRLNLS